MENIVHVIPTFLEGVPDSVQTDTKRGLSAALQAAVMVRDFRRVRIKAVVPDERHLDLLSNFVDELHLPSCVGEILQPVAKNITTARDLGVSRRPYPTLQPFLSALQDDSVTGIGIFTNSDIEVSPQLYLRASSYTKAGGSASITRRTIDENGEFSLGKSHPGHDLFVARISDWKKLPTTETLLGVMGAGRPIMWGLAANTNLRIDRDQALSFHRGDDRDWTGQERAIIQYQVEKLAAYAQRLRLHTDDFRLACTFEKIGAFKNLLKTPNESSVTACVNAVMRSHTEWMSESLRNIVAKNRTSNPRRVYVYGLGGARYGTTFLSQILAQHPQIDSEHERNQALSPRRLAPSLEIEDHWRAKFSTEDHVLALTGKRCYADVSHRLRGDFLRAASEARNWEEVKLVILRRDPLLVAKSIAELGWFGVGAESKTWERWFESDSVQDFRSVLPVDKIFEYIVETEFFLHNTAREYSEFEITLIDVSDSFLQISRNLFEFVGVAIPSESTLLNWQHKLDTNPKNRQKKWRADTNKLRVCFNTWLELNKHLASVKLFRENVWNHSDDF